MKMKKIFAIMMAGFIGMMSFTACGNGSAEGSGVVSESTANTIGTKLYAEFCNEVNDSTDTEVIAEKLSENSIFSDIVMGTIPVEEGYLNGFDDQIFGFTKGTMFAPMIGTIPFVGYIFETDNADALMSTIEEHAMLNWNICTTADEMVIEKSGNLVFFVMAPNSFE